MEIKRSGIHKKGEFNLSDLMRLIKTSPEIDEIGAIAIFCGTVRGFTHDGKAVEKLEIEAYNDEAGIVLNKISEELQTKSGVTEVLIHHLVGTFSVGEDLVYVAVVGPSRNSVFSVLSEAVERYKHEAPIWKKEYLRDGSSNWFSEKHE